MIQINLLRKIVFRSTFTVVLAVTTTCAFAEKWEWLHRNFRLNYWLDTDNIREEGSHRFVNVQVEGVCQSPDGNSFSSYYKRAINTLEVNCDDNTSRRMGLQLFKANGELLRRQDNLQREFHPAPNLGTAKVISKSCGKPVNAAYTNVIDDTQVQEFSRFSTQCVTFGFVSSENKSRLIAESYVDLSRVYSDLGLVFAWVRSVYERPKATQNGKLFAMSESKVAVRCTSRDVATTEHVTFDLNGAVLEQSRAQPNQALRWESARPGTGNDNLVELVCKKAQTTPSTNNPIPQTPPVSPPPKDASNVTSTGSGVRIASAHIVTNDHVINSCKKIRAQGEMASLLATDKRADLALLKVRPVNGSTAQLRQSKIRIGDDVAVAGFPLSGILSGFNVTRGNVSSLSGLGGDTRLLQITAPVQPGNSGGPLVDSNGNLVGVIVSKLSWRALSITGDIPQNVNFAINLNSLNSFLDANNISVPTSSSVVKTMSPADMADKVKGFTVLIECLN